MHECSVHGKRPALTSFVGREDCTTTQNVRELASFLLRLNRKNVLKADDTYGERAISFRIERIQCRNVFHHVASYSYWVLPPEYSTIYTVLKTMQEMSKNLQQSTAVITFDLAIYSKPKEIHWRYPEEFQNLFFLI